jgi:uncharacterized surface protein with fasciclin (FAS1) repeats
MRVQFGAIAAIALAAGTVACGDNSNPAGNDQTVAGEQSGLSLQDGLSGSGEHSSFAQAVEAAGLDETLQGAGPYTVFAPSNEGFDRLEESEREGLLAPEGRSDLTRIISYHIVPGTVTTEDLRNAVQSGGGRTELATVGGGNISVSGEGGDLRLSDGSGNQARITSADQRRANGVVYTIDHVLRPSDEGAAAGTEQ